MSFLSTFSQISLEDSFVILVLLNCFSGSSLAVARNKQFLAFNQVYVDFQKLCSTLFGGLMDLILKCITATSLFNKYLLFNLQILAIIL